MNTKKGRIDTKRPIDIVTLAIPRLVTAKCISSFLDHWTDHGDWCARWFFHLDQYPGMEKKWNANLDQAVEISHRFDECVILSSFTNLGIGGAYLRCFKQVKHDVLVIEDDWLWEKDWCLANIDRVVLHGFSFKRQTQFGATSPSFWRKHVVDALLTTYPEERRGHFPTTTEPMKELHFKRALRHRFKYTHDVAVPKDTCREIGRDVLREFGHTENFCGQKL